MTTTLTSAFDPIFWSHHANLDRLWNVWRSQPGHLNPAYDERCPQTGSNVTWGNLVFDEFVDPHGTQINRTVRDFLEDPVINGVYYKAFPSDRLLAQSWAEAAQRTVELPTERPANTRLQLELGKPITLTIPITREARARLEGLSRQPTRSVIFQLEGVKQPVGFAAVRVRAFLNNPKADAATSYRDPSYAGYFAFFDVSHPRNHEEMPHLPLYSFNLGPVMQKLGDKVRFDRPLTITLVMVPKGPGKEQVEPGRAKAVGAASFQGGKLLIEK
jgi:hypothetical protein